MSTKNTTTQTNQYNQGSMNMYNTLQPAFGNAIQSEINDPYTNMFFQNQLAMGKQANAQSTASAGQALLQRSQALGQNANSPLMLQQMGQIQRQGMAGNAQLFQNLLLQAGQMRQQAIGMAGSYRPLQTGATQTQTQSGLGSWLPQVAGIGLGAGMKLFNPLSGMGSPTGVAGAGPQWGATGASPQMNALLSANTGNSQPLQYF